MRYVAIFTVGAMLGAGIVSAHFNGFLAPVYHRIGLHSLAGHQKPAGTSQEHAGHEGMSMPGMPGMEMPGMKMAMGEPSQVPGHGIVKISAERQQLIGVRKGRVESGSLLMSIRAVGSIEPDQMRVTRLHARIKGWVTKETVNFVGQNVQRGDRLLEIYSPDLLATQQEYVIALQHLESPGTLKVQQHLAQSSLRRLELMGVASEELAELKKTKEPHETLTLRSPVTGRVLERNVLEGSYVEPATELYQIADLSVVWLQAKIYEYELPHIELNQPVTVTLLAEPGEEFRGKVAFIEPIVQELTRTVKVRVEIENPKDLLKPGMYANLQIEHDMGSGLLIPESAVLRTGDRSLAFRALPEGRFEPVAIELGGRFGDRMQVLSGLQEGDEIVVSAGFLIDSESRLKSPGSGGGHHHSH